MSAGSSSRRHQVAKAQAAAARKAASEAAEAATQRAVSAALAEVDSLRGRAEKAERTEAEARRTAESSRRAAAEARAALDAKRLEAQSYETELEAVAQGFEELQAQNARLLQQLTGRDEVAAKVMTDQLQAAQLQRSAGEERDVAVQARALVVAQLEVARKRIGELDGKIKELGAEISRFNGARTGRADGRADGPPLKPHLGKAALRMRRAAPCLHCAVLCLITL